jgi:enamine deaminase RidA (YjgF/YER057c/UK114 family)
MHIEDRLVERDILLPTAVKPYPGLHPHFVWVRVRDNRAYVSPHMALNADGSVAGPYGKVGADVSQEQAREAARGAALAMLASLKQELGDLDRVTAWLTVTGLINTAADFEGNTEVLNGFSEVILDLYGEEAGAHARMALGVATPFGQSVIVAAEVEIDARTS